MSNFTPPAVSRKNQGSSYAETSGSMRSLLSSPLFMSQDVDDAVIRNDKNEAAGKKKSLGANDEGGVKTFISSPFFPQNEPKENTATMPQKGDLGSSTSLKTDGTTDVNGTNHHDDLLRKATSWIEELTEVHEKLQRTRVENAILMDSMYMTGALFHEDDLEDD